MRFTIKNRSSFRRISIAVLNRLQDFLLNSNNANIQSNGELRFVREYVQSLKSGETYTFFDIGANKGEYTELLTKLSDKAKLNYTVHLFEPVAYTFENLKKNIPQTEHLVFNKVGVSDKAGSLNIFYNKAGSPLASLYERDVAEYNIVLDQKEKIDLIRLDDYITQHNIQHIHLLKIDVEGHEIAAFEGMGRFLDGSFVDVIQFEYGGANIDSRTYLKDFFKLLEARGFKLFKINRSNLTPMVYTAALENFKHSNYLAISKKRI